MPAREQTYFLAPYASTEGQAVRGVGGRVTRDGGRLAVSYRLDGALERLRVAPPKLSRFADELWSHTCFELFVRRADDVAYHEFNFSPSTEWAAYGFQRYRERAPLDPAAMAPPRIAVRRSAAALELDVVVQLDAFSPGYAEARLRIALSCVTEADDGELAWWALRHPADKPDFHHPDAFVLEFDEIRN